MTILNRILYWQLIYQMKVFHLLICHCHGNFIFFAMEKTQNQNVLSSIKLRLLYIPKCWATLYQTKWYISRPKIYTPPPSCQGLVMSLTEGVFDWGVEMNYQSIMSPTHWGYYHAKYQSQTHSSHYWVFTTIMCIIIKNSEAWMTILLFLWVREWEPSALLCKNGKGISF